MVFEQNAEGCVQFIMLQTQLNHMRERAKWAAEGRSEAEMKELEAKLFRPFRPAFQNGERREVERKAASRPTVTVAVVAH